MKTNQYKSTSPMILIIDNYDSFTYNLYQLIESLGFKTKVIKNDELDLDKIRSLDPEKIIISPGPKRPEDAGVSMEVIQAFYKEIPILGVCLGHQSIGKVFGVNVVHAKEIMHGKTSAVHHDEADLLKGVLSPFEAARYHSLMIDSVPDGFKLTAWTEDETIMAIEHKDFPLYGIQFHPESFLTPEGRTIMKNFLTHS